MMKGLYWICTSLVLLLIGVSDVRTEQVVFSEIMYHPPGTLPEYIEVRNNTATPLDIAEWQLCDGVDYVFPPFALDAVDRTFLKPFERIVLSAVEEATLRATYTLSPTVRVYGPWEGNLKNAGERLTLRDKNVDLGTAWRAPAFDDSAWPQGPGLFGFETASLPAPGIRTPFTNSQQLTFYARTKFTYNGSLKGVTMTIDQVLDDGAVYYLNGQEIGRSGMASGSVTFTTVASRTTGDAVEELGVITANGSALINGTNVLAVEIHQINRTSSDVVFGMRLNLSVPTQPSLQINEVLPGAAGVGFVEVYNPGTSPINLRDHYLTDDPANLRKFRITTDVVIPAGGLGSVGFTESGLAPASPVKVYLVAPDGVTAINAISTVMPMDGRSIGRKPTGSSSWFLFTEPTRGTPNASQSDIAAEIHLNEVHFSTSKKVDWVEFYNSGDEAVPLDGLFLSSKADLSDKMPLSGSMPAGGVAMKAGMVLATDTSQSVKVAFEDAILVDPNSGP